MEKSSWSATFTRSLDSPSAWNSTIPRFTKARKSCQARRRWASLAFSDSWLSRTSRRMARQPSPFLERTLSSIPWDTWKRETSRSGWAPMSRWKVFSSQATKLRSGGWRFTNFFPGFWASLAFSMTCSGAWATTQPRSSKPFRPARPEIWWKSLALRMAVFCPSYLQSFVKSTVRMGTLMPTPRVSVPQMILSSPFWASRSTRMRYLGRSPAWCRPMPWRSQRLRSGP